LASALAASRLKVSFRVCFSGYRSLPTFLSPTTTNNQPESRIKQRIFFLIELSKWILDSTTTTSMDFIKKSHASEQEEEEEEVA